MKTTVFVLLLSTLSLSQTFAATPTPKDDLFKDYLQIQSLLAKDTFAGVTDAAKRLTADATALKETALAKDSENLSKAKDIAQARDQFEKVSDDVLPLQKKSKSKEREVVYCPMKKARWVQAKGDVHNPYYGKDMLECGVKE